MRRNPAIGAFLLVAPLVAGCARSDDLLPTFATAAPGRAALSESLPPESALAALPREAGAVVSVTERRSTTGLRQTITLTGDAVINKRYLRQAVNQVVAIRNTLGAPS